MKFFTHSIIQKGILGILMLFVLLTPVSVSITTPAVLGEVVTTPQFAMVTNIAAAEGVVSAVLSTITEIGSPVINGVLNAIGLAIMSLAAMITWMGGLMLDYSITRFVLTMADLINGEKFGTSIDETWRLVRDISNLAFIFGFIYAGIRMILDSDSSSAKRFVSKIIIGALLINFSLFFVKVVIDVANFAAVQIYNAMLTGKGTIATTIADRLGIITLYNINDGKILDQIIEGSTKGFSFYIMASIFLVVTGFTFAAAAIMIMIRFVTLVFIMIFSPILFAATVFPNTEHYAKEMWEKLLSSAFYVPVYLLLTFISIKLISGINLTPAGSSFASALVSPTQNSFGILIQFLIIIFFMMQSLLIANKFSIAGSSMITSKAKTLIGASTAGLAAKAGRATVGRWSANAAESDELKDKASQKGIGGWAARQRLKAYRSTGDASFDARNTGAGKDLKIGSGRKGGYVSVKKEVTEKEEKFAKSLGEVGDDDFNVEVRKKEKEAAEKHVRELNVELNAIPKENKEERKRMTEEIEKAKHHIHEAKVAYETEKQRRILGSTFNDIGNSKTATESDKSALGLRRTAIGLKKTSLKNAWEEYLQADSEARKKELEISISSINKGIKSDQDTIHGLLLKHTEMGYAGVLESSTRKNSWPAGRLVVHNQAAGKAMRKARKDGLPKEKESHGGDHGDHGGDAHGDDAHGGDDHAPAGGGHGPAPHAPAGGGHGGGAHH
ncbi:MAG: type IV secretion system protein [Minisyncoccia bacterium]